ncbi:DUF3397 domain-containing protein [Lysinibacillus sp. 54212]|uniref:DUF3397 domain-containing protein n=1 Tax=Lysinibacillus sp. 54212 TaxID=3119829 RepID=UPI002FC9E097
MKEIFQVTGAILLVFPLIALVLTYFICNKLRLTRAQSFGFAADITTLLLFFSVPIAIKSIWDLSLFIPIIIISMMIAIFITYVDWRTKKEIHVPFLFKKIWRIYFILLSTLYFGVWIAGLTKNIMEYVTGV